MGEQPPPPHHGASWGRTLRAGWIQIWGGASRISQTPKLCLALQAFPAFGPICGTSNLFHRGQNSEPFLKAKESFPLLPPRPHLDTALFPGGGDALLYGALLSLAKPTVRGKHSMHFLFPAYGVGREGWLMPLAIPKRAS